MFAIKCLYRIFSLLNIGMTRTLLTLLALVCLFLHTNGYPVQCGNKCHPNKCVDHGVGISPRYRCFSTGNGVTTPAPLFDRTPSSGDISSQGIRVMDIIILIFVVLVAILVAAATIFITKQLRKLRIQVQKLYDKITTEEVKPHASAGFAKVKFDDRNGRTTTVLREPTGQMIQSMQTAQPHQLNRQGIHYSQPCD
ncbi:uncharacterized protein [Ptychodera flava]|uniref:uncharacterized protein n=1 Tax=Ptychodera flava TaxID=63121 RepID=UPI00396A5874